MTRDERTKGSGKTKAVFRAIGSLLKAKPHKLLFHCHLATKKARKITIKIKDLNP